MGAPTLSNTTFRRLAVGAAVAAALHGLLYVPLVGQNTNSDSPSYVAAGEAILHGRHSTPLKAGFYYVYPTGWFDLTGFRFADSTWHEPERQTFRPPGYPLYLAAFGGGGAGASRTLALIGQGVLFGVGTFLLALTVRRWWGPTLGLVAAWLYALDPFSKHYVTLILSEVLAGTVALACLYALTRAWEQRTALAWWALSGSAAAALTLVRAAFAVAVPLVILAALLCAGPVRKRLVAAGASLACAAVLLVPWLGWTLASAGSPVLTSYGEGFNLLLAAHGEGFGRSFAEVSADPAFRRDVRAVYAYAPTTEELRSDPEAHPRYLARADRMMRDEAWSLLRSRIRQEPGQVAWEVAYRSWFLWAAHEDWYQPGGGALVLLQALDWATITLALVGVGVALVRGGAARAAAIFLLAYTLVIATHHVEARFAMPVRGVLLAFVTFALAELHRRASRGEPATKSQASAGHSG